MGWVGGGGGRGSYIHRHRHVGVFQSKAACNISALLAVLIYLGNFPG